MNVISLGHACQVKFNIDRLFKNAETNFFDWLITDFKTVLYILKNINNAELITKSKFTDKEVFKPGNSWIKRYHKIECIEFKMISIHDFPSNIDFIDYMDEFILKYNRRLHRLKKIINSAKNVHMIHCLDHQFTDGYIITNNDILDFKKHLRDINSNNNCFLHIVIPPKYNNIDFNHLIQDKVYVYYLHETPRGNNNWKNTNFNWNVIFDNINNIG
jgi:hypothetical protein